MIVSPFKPVREYDRAPSSDDRVKAGGFPLLALDRMMSSEHDDFAQWRDRTAQAFAYYDGDSITDQLREMARKYNLEPRATNLVARVVNVALGQEEKSRRDPKIEPDDDDYSDVAEVLQSDLKEAQRETSADQEIGAAYAEFVKGGIGWVSVFPRADPFCYKLGVEAVPWKEMTWDRRARKADLSDRAWDRRSRWVDLDAVVSSYPDHRDVLLRVAGGSAAMWDDHALDEDVIVTTQGQDRPTQGWFGTRRSSWYDGRRERVRMSEVEYKVPASVVVMTVRGRKIVFDAENQAHIEAVSRGGMRLEKATSFQYRRAIFAGPYRLSDEPTGLKNKFSRTPMVAFARDSDRLPYGLIEGMIGPQDDYNESDIRLRWMLLAQQLIIDEDALATKFNTIEDIVDTMMRPDMVAVLSNVRRNQDAMKFRNDFELQRELYERMSDRRQMMQDVPGIYNAQMGNGQPGGSSGVAISGLVEQGMTTMGEMNGNFASARRQIYDVMLGYLVEDRLERDMQVKIGSGQSRRVVTLNTLDQETGEPINLVKGAPIKLGLGEVPSSPAYMAQSSQQIGQMVQALAGTPQAALLVPMWVEQTTAFGPGRKQLAEEMRRMAGLPNSQDKDGAQQLQQQQAQEQQKAAQMQESAVTAKIKLTEAQAAKTSAEALEKLSGIAAMTAANEDQMIQQALAEALPNLSQSQGQPAPAPEYEAAAQ